MSRPSDVQTLPLRGHHRAHREATIPEAFAMTMIIPKTSGKITKIGMRTRMKRGMSGMTVNLKMRVPVSSNFNS